MILTWNAVFRKRIPASPAILELPTIAESGFPGFEVTVWYGLLAPAGTPATIVRNLPLETAKTLAHPDLHAKLADLDLEGIGIRPMSLPRPSSPGSRSGRR